MLRLNETLIYDKGTIEIWKSGLIASRFAKKVGAQPLNSVQLSHIYQSSDVTSATLLDIVTIGTAQDGISKFSINFDGATLSGPIDNKVQEEFCEKLS